MALSEETDYLLQKFDPPVFPENILLHDRRSQKKSAQHEGGSEIEETIGESEAAERPMKKERRRRVDPTTFEKQYTEEEIEFMNAMQQFKSQTGRAFPTFGDVLSVAQKLGYRKCPND